MGYACQGRLARITAYWPGEDYYTNHKRSATGVRLREGYCAVDSSIIPYGSVVKIPGVGDYIAVLAKENRTGAGSPLVEREDVRHGPP